MLVPLCFVDDHQGFLVYRSEAQKPGMGEFVLLALDGSFQPVRGQPEPFLDALDQPLQSAAGNDFWVAVPTNAEETQIGTIDRSTLEFKSRATFPHLQLSSSQIWVDETAGTVYATSGGDLLSLPIAQAGP